MMLIGLGCNKEEGTNLERISGSTPILHALRTLLSDLLYSKATCYWAALFILLKKKSPSTKKNNIIQSFQQRKPG